MSFKLDDFNYDKNLTQSQREAFEKLRLPKIKQRQFAGNFRGKRQYMCKLTGEDFWATTRKMWCPECDKSINHETHPEIIKKTIR